MVESVAPLALPVHKGLDRTGHSANMGGKGIGHNEDIHDFSLLNCRGVNNVFAIARRFDLPI